MVAHNFLAGAIVFGLVLMQSAMAADSSLTVPLPDNAPRKGTIWRHVTSDARYMVVSSGYNESDGAHVVIYTADHELFWVRSLHVFLDRFRPVTP